MQVGHRLSTCLNNASASFAILSRAAGQLTKNAKSSYTQSFFFFSSRRRHTRLQGDWSSDVCSSDLPPAAGAGVRNRPNALERHGGIFRGARRTLDERAYVALQRVHARIGMGPAVGEPGRVQRPEERSDARTRQQQRAGGDEQADGELDRIDLIEQVLALEETE